MRRASLGWPLALLAGATALTFFTVYDQIFHRTGIAFILQDQLERHRAVLEGTSIDPWQYRILPELVVEAVVRAARWLQVDDPTLLSFIVVRAAQNLAIFLAAALYWARLGVARLHRMIGLAILAWGFSYAGYASDLALSSYFDLLFYLIAGLLILAGKDLLLLAVVVLATLNRETAGLIPLMLFAGALGADSKLDRRRLLIAGGALMLFVLEYAVLRNLIGERPFMRPHGRTLGMGLLELNLTWLYSYFSTIASFSLIPWLALLYWRRWPPILKRFFWAIVPIWLSVHLVFGAIAEARLLLVPYVIVLLPAALLVVQRERPAVLGVA